jgi:hypothetical protein
MISARITHEVGGRTRLHYSIVRGHSTVLYSSVRGHSTVLYSSVQAIGAPDSTWGPRMRAKGPMLEASRMSRGASNVRET